MNIILKTLSVLPILTFLSLGWISYSINNNFLGVLSMIAPIVFVPMWSIARKRLENI